MNDLTIVSNGIQLSGWTEVSLVRGIERIPSGFTVSMTDRYPGEPSKLRVRPGDAAQVFLGSDLVITGYIDTFAPEMTAMSHGIRLEGRGKCQDLIECSHAWPGGQMANVTIKQIAEGLCQGYGIDVLALVDTGEAIPFVNLQWGDTPYASIEKHARYRQLLVYENAAGNLVLNRADAVPAPKVGAAIKEGVNIESASVRFSVSGRYSEYVVRSLSLDSLSDIGGGPDIQAVYQDPAITRFRRRSIIAESGDQWGYEITKARAQWEAARRAGRGSSINVRVSSWRDLAGRLWEPNTLVSVECPSLRLSHVSWLIAEVTYSRDASGTHADLVLMPKEAFSVEPINLFPGMADVVGVGG